MRVLIRIAEALAALPLVPAAAQQAITAPGTIAHRPAETGFPETVGEFRRSGVTRYDAEGRDMGANYNLIRPGGRVVLTIYIYPAPSVVAAPGSNATAAVARAQLCRREFAGVHQAITAQYGNGTLVEEGQAPAKAGVGPELSLRSVHRIRTRFDDRVQDLRSETDLYCYVGGEWLVKYRISTPQAVDAEGAVESFIRAGPWPGRRLGSPGDAAGIAPGSASPAAR